jgi:hypothetical protein
MGEVDGWLWQTKITFDASPMAGASKILYFTESLNFSSLSVCTVLGQKKNTVINTS